MGFAWIVTSERELPGVSASSVGGRALGPQGEAMDALALGLGLTPLGEFLSLTPEGWEELTGEELPEDMREVMPPDAWFSAADGLATVRGLLAAFDQDSEASATYHPVIEDLREIEAVLVVAEAHGVRFHLSPDF